MPHDVRSLIAEDLRAVRRRIEDGGISPSRERSLTVTKVDEALLWLGETTLADGADD